MKLFRRSLPAFVATLLLCSWLSAQQAAVSTSTTAIVPRLVNYSGKATNEQGKAITGVAGATFAIYSEQFGGSSLWLETQSVQLDSKGGYTAQMGASKPEGLPLELFTSGEARWLGVRINGGEEQPRVLLLSVPYALKAADAETLGGRPPSAFMLAGPPVGGGASGSSSLVPSAVPSTSSDVTTTGGTANTLPLFTTGTNIQSSALTQTGTGASAKIGIGVTTPAATLDVKGSTLVRGNLGLAATGNATAAAGKNSQPQTFSASSYSSGTSAPVTQNLRWQAEPAGNDTASPSATLNFLYGSGGSTPAETGLKISSNGQITFAPSQTFPGGSGTVTSVGLIVPNTDFTTTGSPVTSSGTLGLKWNVTPSAAATANAIVKRDASGNFAANLITAGNLQVTATGEGIGSVSTGNFSNTAAISGRSEATGDGTTHGLNGFSSTNQGSGVYGENFVSGHGVLGVATGTSGQGVWGKASAQTSTASARAPTAFTDSRTPAQARESPASTTIQMELGSLDKGQDITPLGRDMECTESATPAFTEPAPMGAECSAPARTVSDFPPTATCSRPAPPAAGSRRCS